MTKCTLVGITQPRNIDGIATAEELVAYAARVSNPANQNNNATATKLLKYLATNHHWSPFEMISLTIEIETTRDIARQILRHRSFAFQEFSQRYASVESLGFTMREARMQDAKNRQASNKTDDEELQHQWQAAQTQVLTLVKTAYAWALENGIAKEQARAVLPEGMTNSRLYMAGTLRSWIHYCQLRCEMGTQAEHREVAEQCLAIILQEIPSLKEILGNDSNAQHV